MGICIDCGGKTSTKTCLRCRTCNLKLPRTEEWKRKHSELLKGRKKTPEHLKKLQQSYKNNRERLINEGVIKPKGAKNCIDCNIPISRGKSYRCFECYLKLPRPHSEECKRKISLAQKGKPRPAESIRKMAITKTGQTSPKKGIPLFNKRGENHHNWKGGMGKRIRMMAMGQIEYIQWRKSVFERDNYTCQICNVKGGKLHADHIQPWATHIDLRYEITNGRTLCVPCHRKTDTWGGKIFNKNKKQHAA